MNWRGSLNKKAYLAIFGVLFLLLLIGINSYFKNVSEKYWAEIPTPQFIAAALNYTLDVRQIPVAELSNLTNGEYGEMKYIWNGIDYAVTFSGAVVKDLQFSPDNKYIIFMYPHDQQSIEHTLVVYNLETKNAQELYTGRISSRVHWIGVDYVYFNVYCGTSCSGLDLVSIKTGEMKRSVISYLYADDRDTWYTHLKNWNGDEFEFNGLGGDIATETVDNKNYLIFNLTDGESNYLGQKKFLFTGNRFLTE